jgi:protein SCO1
MSIQWNRTRTALLSGALLIAAMAALLITEVRPSDPPLPILGRVDRFALTNQFGRVVSSDSLLGSVWVGDIIFTRCPGPCTAMTRNLAQLEASLPPGLPVRIVSLTADPGHDQPEILRQYALKVGRLTERWDFLTGDRAVINDVATRQLLLAVAEVPEGEKTGDADLFIHSTKFVLVDGQGRIRAVYEGTEPSAVTEIPKAVRRLLRERNG